MSNKIVLGQRSTKQLTLPFSGVTVEIYTSLLLGEANDIDSKKLAEGDTHEIKKNLKKLICSWNAYGKDTDETPLEINEANLDLIPTKDIEYIINSIVDVQEEEKKRSQST